MHIAWDTDPLPPKKIKKLIWLVTNKNHTNIKLT